MSIHIALLSIIPLALVDPLLVLFPDVNYLILSIYLHNIMHSRVHSHWTMDLKVQASGSQTYTYMCVYI